MYFHTPFVFVLYLVVIVNFNNIYKKTSREQLFSSELQTKLIAKFSLAKY